MKKTCFNTMDYLITAAVNLISLVLYFLNAMRLEYRSVEETVSLGELADVTNVPVFGVLGTLIVIMNIVGILVAALPLIKAYSGVAAIPQIKDGLFLKLQGAPVGHAILVLFWMVYISGESAIEVSLTFGGVLALLAGIASVIWRFKLSGKHRSSKKAEQS